MPFKVLEERSRLGSSMHVYVILGVLMLVLGLSAFMMTPQHQVKSLKSDWLLGKALMCSSAAPAKCMLRMMPSSLGGNCFLD